MTIVYRIQNKDGVGPYKSFGIPFVGYGLDRDNIWLEASNLDIHPCPYEEGLPINGRFCGFKDLEQLSRWFTDDELVKLAEYGFEIVEVEAEDVAIGRRQVTFIPKQSLQKVG